MTLIRIRDAVAADLDEPIVGGSGGEYREQLTRHLAGAEAGEAAVFVAEVDGRVVGRAFVEQSGDPPVAWLGGVLVEDAHRRQGIATALVDYAEKQTVKLGRDELRLSVGVDNVGAQRLYLRRGYWTIGKGFSPGLTLSDGTLVHPREAVWVMSRSLAG